MYDERLELDKAIEAEAQKRDDLKKICAEKKTQGACYCAAFKEMLLIDLPRPNYTTCDVCFNKLQDDEDWHHRANFLSKSWTEESLDPGP